MNSRRGGRDVGGVAINNMLTMFSSPGPLPYAFNVKSTKKTYNSEDSPVVTDPSTNSPLLSLTKGERTGSRIF
ncbi:hypothetical protein BKA56DRAFT_603226 [Ilyonectria sp. MPI-CAGE-AT-0026]|nr:hypothetical protein BKA56DRAFT_603226 [Ilyonectria sp. MPI-CAGE-AT-0026]